jgi:hypothetical protein
MRIGGLNRELAASAGLGPPSGTPLSFAVFNSFLPRSRNSYAIWIFFLAQNVPRALILYFGYLQLFWFG